MSEVLLNLFRLSAIASETRAVCVVVHSMLRKCRVYSAVRCRANFEHISLPRPDSDLDGNLKKIHVQNTCIFTAQISTCIFTTQITTKVTPRESYFSNIHVLLGPCGLNEPHIGKHFALP